jgi:transposase
MAKTLSQDRRSRVIGAVESGLARRAAAERFGVGVATAIRRVREFRATGATAAKRKGGDLRSRRIEAFRVIIRGAVKAHVDITLVELAEMLHREQGVSFARDQQGLRVVDVAADGAACAGEQQRHFR